MIHILSPQINVVVIIKETVQIPSKCLKRYIPHDPTDTVWCGVLEMGHLKSLRGGRIL